MLKINKIAIKAILPELVLTFALSAVTLGAGVYTANKTVKTTGQITTHDKWLLTLMAFMLFYIYLDTYCRYRKVKNFSAHVARKYLRKSMKDMPEMKIFGNLLDNPKAMKNIATLIFNSLRPSEQKLVKNIVSDTLAGIKKYEKCYLEDEQLEFICKKLFVKASGDITKIIQEHASVHPEFIQNIYKSMAHTDMIYTRQQRTR